MVLLGLPGRMPSGVVEKVLAAYSCGGSFVSRTKPRRIPCYSLAGTDAPFLADWIVRIKSLE